MESTPSFPGFHGFLESAEFYTRKAWKSMESQEKIFHTFMAFPCMQELTQKFLAHIPQRPGK